ncbi:Telomerase Cajal body protein 1 [Linum perenne]
MAFTLTFDDLSGMIYAGYNKCIRVFNVHRPGRDFVQHSTLKGNKEGQTGVISSISFSPHHGGMLATGSFSQSTAIYREDTIELLYLLQFIEKTIWNSCISYMDKKVGLHMCNSQMMETIYTREAERNIISWCFVTWISGLDCNEDSSLCCMILAGPIYHVLGCKESRRSCLQVRLDCHLMKRLYRSSAQTNQRIYFDVDSHGRHLGTGGQDGLVDIYNLQTRQWISGFQAAADTVNGFAFHPSLPMAVSSSGPRRFQMTKTVYLFGASHADQQSKQGTLTKPSPLDPL